MGDARVSKARTGKARMGRLNLGPATMGNAVRSVYYVSGYLGKPLWVSLELVWRD